MQARKITVALALSCTLAACGDPPDEARGVDRDETLLSVSATGEAETRPDRAHFQAGINTWAGTAKEANAANLAKIDEIVAALRKLGIAEKDIQTRAVSVQRIEYGDRKGQYQASNIVNVIVRDIEKAGPAVTTVTDAGANLVSGPDLRMADPEEAANKAYASAYKAARTRAVAYATAAGMEISRVLSIRDAGGMQGNRYLPGAVAVAPPPPHSPPMIEQNAVDASAPSSRIMPGQTASNVSIQVDFALEPKSWW